MAKPRASKPDRSPRRRSAPATREAILQAARERFSADGYEGTTLRAVAADVGVDPAMVIRYFGNKESLFAQAVEVDLRLPNLTDVQPDQLAQVLLPHFFRIWESDSTFLALLRASATNPEAAATLQGLFVTQTGPVLQTAALDHPAQRAAMLGAFVFGVGMTRNILKATVLNEMTQVELERWLGSLIHWALRDPDVVKDLN